MYIILSAIYPYSSGHIPIFHIIPDDVICKLKENIKKNTRSDKK